MHSWTFRRLRPGAVWRGRWVRPLEQSARAPSSGEMAVGMSSTWIFRSWTDDLLVGSVTSTWNGLAFRSVTSCHVASNRLDARSVGLGHWVVHFSTDRSGLVPQTTLVLCVSFSPKNPHPQRDRVWFGPGPLPRGRVRPLPWRTQGFLGRAQNS